MFNCLETVVIIENFEYKFTLALKLIEIVNGIYLQKKTNASQKKKGSERFQPDIIALTGNQKKGLPSHWGPKIRHKARPELNKARNQKSSVSDKHAIPTSKKVRSSFV